MIGKMTKGQSAYGLIQYLLGENGQSGEVRQYARVIGGTCDGETVNEITKNMMRVRALKPGLKTYMVNESLRLKEGQKLEAQEWAELADSWAQGLGFDTYSIIQHSDSEVHIAALRIKADGTTVSDSQDYKRSESLIRQLEVEFGLEQVKSSHLLNKEKDHIKAPSLGELAMFDKTKKVPPRYFIADKIDDIIKKAGGKVSATDFIKKLQEVGIEPIANVQSTGRLAGFSFKYDGIKLTGEKVGQKYKWGNLKERVEYVQSRDFIACADTKISTEFRHDIADEIAARKSGSRTEEDIKRIDGDIEREEALAREKQAAKQQAERDREDKRSVVISDKNRINSGWWTSSDITNRIVHDAITSQLNSMPANKYSIRLLRRDSKEAPITRTYTREQLLNPKTIAWLRYQNMNKEILMRPLDRHYFVLDDLSKDAVDCLKDKGFKPCLVNETSSGNNQAWFNIKHKDLDVMDISLLEFIIIAIMRLFGIHLEAGGFYVDRAAMTRDRYGKLSGFTNRKPSREYQQNGRVLVPFVKVIEARDTAISGEQAELLLQYAAGEFNERYDKDEEKREQRAVSALTNIQPKEPLDIFFARKMKESDKTDQSAKDASVVTSALRAGYHPLDVEEILKSMRQDKKDPAYYAKHTVDRCVDFILFKKEEHDKQRAQEQYDAMQL